MFVRKSKHNALTEQYVDLSIRYSNLTARLEAVKQERDAGIDAIVYLEKHIKEELRPWIEDACKLIPQLKVRSDASKRGHDEKMQLCDLVQLAQKQGWVLCQEAEELGIVPGEQEG
jgi:hypothetical protein